ncbi:NUDIX hydrolase [Streptococcus pluranimalium]
MLSSIEKTLKSYHPKPIGQDRAYAVLLPLMRIDDEWHVLYEVRSEKISQPGEVAFPGGRIEEGECPEAAAIRETQEELNLPKKAITILGEIDYLVQHHRTIHCFVGEININCLSAICPNKDEVAKVFTIPLSSLMETPPTYYKLRAKMKPGEDFPVDRLHKNGKDYRFTSRSDKIPFYEQGPETLWGLTAMFTHRFTEIIKECDID